VILALDNHWQAAAVPQAVERMLPSGVAIRTATPPYLLATKLEAFADRGRDDPIASRDFEDIITLMDSRAEILEEVRAAPGDVRAYLADRLTELQKIPDFLTMVAAMLRPDRASQTRMETVVLPRLQEISRSA
jgi:predicted nucleotidyltransferase